MNAEQQQKLEAGGWSVVDNIDHVMLRPSDAMPDVDRVRVNLNADGTLHLVRERSDFHRKLAAIIDRPLPAAEGADYAPRAYGQ